MVQGRRDGCGADRGRVEDDGAAGLGRRPGERQEDHHERVPEHHVLRILLRGGFLWRRRGELDRVDAVRSAHAARGGQLDAPTQRFDDRSGRGRDYQPPRRALLPAGRAARRVRQCHIERSLFAAHPRGRRPRVSGAVRDAHGFAAGFGADQRLPRDSNPVQTARVLLRRARSAVQRGAPPSVLRPLRFHVVPRRGAQLHQHALCGRHEDWPALHHRARRAERAARYRAAARYRVPPLVLRRDLRGARHGQSPRESNVGRGDAHDPAVADRAVLFGLGDVRAAQRVALDPRDRAVLGAESGGAGALRGGVLRERGRVDRDDRGGGGDGADGGHGLRGVLHGVGRAQPNDDDARGGHQAAVPHAAGPPLDLCDLRDHAGAHRHHLHRVLSGRHGVVHARARERRRSRRQHAQNRGAERPSGRQRADADDVREPGAGLRLRGVLLLGERARAGAAGRDRGYPRDVPLAELPRDFSDDGLGVLEDVRDRPHQLHKRHHRVSRARGGA